MMRKLLLAVLLLPAALVCAQALKPVPLPAPQTSGGKPLMQALKERQSTREYGPQKLSPQVLSNLLWAAWGINRPDGRRTAPSASNRQEIDVYLITADGAYVYDAKANALNTVVEGDVRKAAASQANFNEAPLNLVYVADFTKIPGNDDNNKTANANVDTGFIAQNVYLFCASEGLGAVTRGSADKAALSKALNLGPNQRVILAQTVGYLKK
jgi:SagB-type dehydrogenase family enzyme